ncbi:MAG: hypothetical protein QGI51_06890 [Dehalococcoidales bacterium]|jgi:hypothetical protein|nr:hypothetical protein [Dehalococcoidales bacterium]|tara:strand:+ start:432 stop:623 length:192 start_codon:yes stop_codon:yes gene_type:complete
MSKVLNIIGGLAIIWIILHGIWNVGGFDPNMTGILEAVQVYEGFFALAVGIGMLVIFIQIKRK